MKLSVAQEVGSDIKQSKCNAEATDGTRKAWPSFEKGYFKALLDLLEFIDLHNETLKLYRNKKYLLVLNLVRYLVKHREKRDLFMRYGGHVEVIVNNSQITEIVNLKEKVG